MFKIGDIVERITRPCQGWDETMEVGEYGEVCDIDSRGWLKISCFEEVEFMNPEFFKMKKEKKGMKDLKVGDTVKLKEFDESLRGSQCKIQPEMIRHFGKEHVIKTMVSPDRIKIKGSTYSYDTAWLDTTYPVKTPELTKLSVLSGLLDKHPKDLTLRKLYIEEVGEAIIDPDLLEYIKYHGLYKEVIKTLIIDTDRDVRKAPEAKCLDFLFLWNLSDSDVDWWGLSLKYPDFKKEQENTYHFMDTEIDIEQLCMDTLESGKYGFMVSANKDDRVYVGFCKCDDSVSFEFPGETQDIHRDSMFEIYEIEAVDKDAWKEVLTQFSKDFKTWRQGMDARIKDRTRDKSGKFKMIVTTF